jgi:dihydrofolate reductase
MGVDNVIRAIVAVDLDGAIGWSDGRLPWHLPEDLQRFKQLTIGHTVVMGHNTFKSLNRPLGLPGRQNVVLTSRPEQDFGEGISIIRSLDDLTQIVGYDELSGRETWIIGGAQLYEHALTRGYIDEFHVTIVERHTGADVRLTTDLQALQHGAWQMIDTRSCQDHRYLVFRRSAG